MQVEPYRWRLSPSFLAHLWKAVTQQHHRELLPALRTCIPRDSVVFDIGAHAGQFAKLFAGLAYRGRVYAIEPGSYARMMLRTAIALHRLSNVTILPLALGDETRLKELNIPLKGSGAVGFGLSHFASEPRAARLARETVVQTTLDDLVTSLALDRLDFIKADIEGSELRMLEGARRSLERFSPRLLIELTDEHLGRLGDTVAEAFGFLLARDYRAYALTPDGKFVPVVVPRDGDLWFFPAGDPLTAT